LTIGVPVARVCEVDYSATVGSVAIKSCPGKSGKVPIQRILQGLVWRGALGMACVFLLALALAPELPAQSGSSSPTGISVQQSEQIFDTLCALDAAGFQSDQSTLGDLPERLALEGDLLKLQGPATLAVRTYYRGHPEADPDALLSRYVTFALTVGPPPDFSFELSEDELPPEALSLEDFQPLLSAFYKEADLGARWKQVAPEYEPLAGKYRSIVRAVVVKTSAYLREVIGAQNGRSFTVYVEPLVGSHTDFRNLGDQYAVVVGARPADSAELIQHAYIHFMVDPLVLKDRDALLSKTPIFNIAARAPQLPEEDRDDLVSYVDECVVKAIELRLRDLPAAEQESVLKHDDETGFVMVRPLVAGLEKFEKDNPSMTYYLPDLIAGVDVAAEQKRLQGIQFATLQPAPAAVTQTPSQAAASQKESLLAEGDREIALRDGNAAAAIFKKVLDAYPNEPHALYGLAVASVLTGHADESKQLFQRVVASSSSTGPGADSGKDAADPTALAWSHIYLGRIDDLEGNRDLAVTEYRAALAVAGAPESARIAAQRGVDQAYAPPTPNRGGNSQQQP
jgi:tetratricopeptide (TPR) repeat protein